MPNCAYCQIILERNTADTDKCASGEIFTFELDDDGTCKFCGEEEDDHIDEAQYCGAVRLHEFRPLISLPKHDRL